MTSSASTGIDSFRIDTEPSAATCSIRSVPASDIVTDCSLWAKSPLDIADTWLLESLDQAPMECGLACA